MPSPAYEKLRKYSEVRWTNYTWYVIHTVCLYAYLKQKDFDEEVDRYREFFALLPEELPCPECSEHCYGYIKENPINKKMNMHDWATKFHNAVNTRLEKKTFTPSETKKFYLEKEDNSWNLVIDWTFYYYMVKIYANVAYTNRAIEHFCEFIEALRKVVPDKSVKRDLPKLRDATDKNMFIRKYLAVLKRAIPSRPPKIMFGEDS
jgi:hypothetical protein